MGGKTGGIKAVWKMKHANYCLEVDFNLEVADSKDVVQSIPHQVICCLFCEHVVAWNCLCDSKGLHHESKAPEKGRVNGIPRICREDA